MSAAPPIKTYFGMQVWEVGYQDDNGEPLLILTQDHDAVQATEKARAFLKSVRKSTTIFEVKHIGVLDA